MDYIPESSMEYIVDRARLNDQEAGRLRLDSSPLALHERNKQDYASTFDTIISHFSIVAPSPRTIISRERIHRDNLLR